MKTRTFETRGPVDPVRNYVVPRTEEIADLKKRIEMGGILLSSHRVKLGKRLFFAGRWMR